MKITKTREGTGGTTRGQSRFILAMIWVLGAFMVIWAGPTGAQTPTPEERVTALKGSLAVSQELLKQYEWIETTVVSVKGEEKSRQMNRCYHGADGKVQKVPQTAPPPAEKKRGIRGKIAESKKEEMTEYMKNAVGLLRSYIPPEPVRIEASQNLGKMSITPAGPRVRLDFRDYLKPDDTFGIEIDVTKNTLLGLKVSTWLKDPKDVVTLVSSFGTLNDGATYPAEITLSAPGESLMVKITNSGYRKP